MTAPQQPGQPTNLPLVNAALGGRASPQPGQTFADIALTGAPPPPPSQQPTAAPGTLPATATPLPYSGRAQELLALLSPEAQAETIAAHQEQMARLAEQAEQAGFLGGLGAGAAALAEGIYSGISALPRGVAALGYAATGSETLKDFVRETAPENLFPTISGTAAFVASDRDELGAVSEFDRAALETEESRAAQRREWATLTTVAETAGLIAGSIATAYAGGAAVGAGARALGIGSQALRGATAAELAFGGGVARQAAIAGVEGALQGAAGTFDDGGTPTQQDILQSALISGLLSAGIAGTTTAIGARLARRGLKRAAQADEAIPTAKTADDLADEPLENLQAKVFEGRDIAAERAADDVARQVAPDAPPGVGREAIEVKQFYDELDAERRAKIDAAGPNPKAKAEAAEKATAEMAEKLDEMKRSAGAINEDNWRGIKPTLRPLLREEIIEAASRDLERSNNALMKATDAIEGFLDEAPQKVEKVRANLKASKIDNAAAMREAYGTLQELRRTFSETLMQRSREAPLKKSAGQAARAVRLAEPDPAFWKSHSSVISSIERTLKKADEAFAQAKDAADAYIVMDQTRREIAARVSGLAKAVRSDDPRVFDPARMLQRWAKDEYLGRLVPHLGDTTVYGQQGAAQSSVNLARRDVIASGYLGDLTTTLQKDFGEAVRVTDPGQTRALLNELDAGRRSLKQQQLLKNYSSLEDMARAVKNGYELTPKQAQAVDEMIKYARSAREIMQTMEVQGSAVREKIIRSLMSHATGSAAGILVGGVAGGPIGSLLGAVVLPIVQNAAQDIVRRVALATAKEAVEEGAERVVREVAESGTQKVARKISKATATKISAAALGIGTGASGLIFAPTEGKPREERLKIHRARQETLAQLTSNPARGQAAFERVTGNLAEKRPIMTGVMAMGMTAKLKRLQHALPGKDQLGPLAALQKKQPSDSELRKSEALWEAATDPTSVFDDWKNGRIDYDKVRFSQELYPGIWELYRAGIVDALGALPEDTQINSSTLTQLDFLFGFNGTLSPTVSRQFSARIDGYAQQLKEEQSQERPGGQLSLPTAKPTYTERVASGMRRS